MEKLYRLYLDGSISSQGFGDRHRPLEARQAQLAEEIPRLEGEADFLTNQLLSSEEIVGQARDLYGRWSSLTADEKRAIVEQIADRIEIGEGNISIHLTYSPDPSSTVAERQRNRCVAFLPCHSDSPDSG